MNFTNSQDTDWLIDQAKRFESLATSSATFDKEDLIEFFNAELQSVLTPIVQSVNEEYGVMVVDYLLASLTDLEAIRIPSQATGARLRNVQFVSPQGFVQSFPRVNPDKLDQVSQLSFYIRNNELVFYPRSPSSVSGTLRLTYFRRSNVLTTVVSTGRVIAIDTVGGLINLDNSPVGSDWIAGNQIDIIVGSSPYDFRARSVTIIAITGSIVQIDLETAAILELGDYFALQGFTPVPQFVPQEAMQLLAQLGAARCLQSLGDTEGWKISQAKIDQMTKHLINLISDRIEGQPKRLSAIGMSRRTSLNGWWV